jgi:hypothetical protein
MKPFKIKSKPILKKIIVSWYGEFFLKFWKEKPIKFIRRIPLKYFNYLPIGHKKYGKKNKSFEKDFWKQGPIFTLQKFITTILIEDSPKKNHI